MSNYLRSKMRVLGICKLQGRLARRDYLQAEKNIARLEVSREQLQIMAGQMFDSDGDIPSAMLSAQLEFGQRLLTLDRLQQTKITQAEEAAVRLRCAAYLSVRREDLAEQNFRQATKSSEIRHQKSAPPSIRSGRSRQGKSRKGMTV